MREKLAAYSFTVSWVPGKTHMIADALSRAPYFAGSEESEVYCNAVTCLKMSSDPALDWLSQCKDRDYDNLRQAVLTGKKYKHVEEGTFGRLFKEQWDEISVDMDTDLLLLNNRQIIVPNSAVKSILKLLHKGCLLYTSDAADE